MVVDELPSPVEAQRMRAHRLWEGVDASGDTVHIQKSAAAADVAAAAVAAAATVAAAAAHSAAAAVNGDGDVETVTAAAAATTVAAAAAAAATAAAAVSDAHVAAVLSCDSSPTVPVLAFIGKMIDSGEVRTSSIDATKHVTVFIFFFRLQRGSGNGVYWQNDDAGEVCTATL
jgi:anti-sigma factor RsiW